MTIARLRRKLGADEPDRLEDLLTSDVLGAFRYLPVDVGIGALLDAAYDERKQSFKTWRNAAGIEWKGAAARILFWPALGSREPDAFVRIWSHDETPAMAALIEAKLDSSQHRIVTDRGDTVSQLGWYAAQHQHWKWGPNVAAACPGRRPTVFITAHPICPDHDLAIARAEAVALTGLAADQIALFWIGWRNVADFAEQAWARVKSRAPREPWLRHLRDVFHHLELRGLRQHPPFECVDRAPALPSCTLAYPPAPPRVPACGMLAAYIRPAPVLPSNLGASDDDHR